MTEELPVSKKTQLAFAIAQGKSVALWARHNGVPRSTAFYWTKNPEVHRLVETCRRRSLDRAVGQMASRAKCASEGITKLAREAESESVRLKAWRAILSNPIAVSKLSNLEDRLVEIEEQLRDRNGCRLKVHGTEDRVAQLEERLFEQPERSFGEN